MGNYRLDMLVSRWSASPSRGSEANRLPKVRERMANIAALARPRHGTHPETQPPQKAVAAAEAALGAGEDEAEGEEGVGTGGSLTPRLGTDSAAATRHFLPGTEKAESFCSPPHPTGSD
jgi:hypothetical protein